MKASAEVCVSGTLNWQDGGHSENRPRRIKITVYGDGHLLGYLEFNSNENPYPYEYSQIAMEPWLPDPVHTSHSIVLTDGNEQPITGYKITYNGWDITLTSVTDDVLAQVCWDGDESLTDVRPEGVNVYLLQNNNIYKTIKISSESDWETLFTDLPKYNENDGTVNVYRVDAEDITNYKKVIEGNTIKYTLDKAVIQGEIVWNDYSNADGIRPNAATINIYRNGELYEKQVVSEDTHWKYTFSADKVDMNGEAYTYTVEAEDYDGYAVTVDNSKVLYTRTTDVRTDVHWTGDNVEIRPTAAVVRLYADGVELKKKSISAEDVWTWTFKNLPKYQGDKEIVYTVKANDIKDYVLNIDGTDVTYTYNYRELFGKLVWNDNNALGTRPNSVKVTIYANGEYLTQCTTGKDLDWECHVSKLPRYDSQGNAYVYAVNVNVDGYEAVSEGNVENGFMITLTRKAGTAQNPETNGSSSATNNSANNAVNNITNKTTDNPKTGDNTPVVLMIVILAVSVVVIVGAVIYILYNKRKHTN